MKCSWFNTDDISSYYPKWNVKVDPMYKAFVVHQTNLDIKNEYLTGKKENKDMSRGTLFKFLT